MVVRALVVRYGYGPVLREWSAEDEERGFGDDEANCGVYGHKFHVDRASCSKGQLVANTC